MRLSLAGKPYFSKSIIASNQRSVNNYAEINDDPQAPVPITLYPMPGTTLFATPGTLGASRATYRTSIGTAYTVVGQFLYFVTEAGALALVGQIADRPSQVIMADNGLALVLVDGTQGWAVDLATNTFGEIIDPAFYGADYVVFLDTFFVFNRPDTNQFYISLSMVTYAMLTGGTAFDPLDIAAKAGSADNIVGISTTHKELWLIGELTTEIWIGTGAADFYFQLQQGAYIDHGSAAQFSIASQDVNTFFISQDKQGNGIVVLAAQYQLNEISTPAIVNEFKSYSTLTDAIGTTFQISDHIFYVVSFPTANKTWCFDLKSGLWNEWAWFNETTGNLDRHRINTAMFVYGMNLIGDWETGKIWKLDPNMFQDDTVPIIRMRTFMHLLDDNFNRISYKNFDADIETGTITHYDAEEESPPQISLSWSDDRGKTFSFPLEQSLGSVGDYASVVSWNRLGMARDRVFKLQWVLHANYALNGAFITLTPHRS